MKTARDFGALSDARWEMAETQSAEKNEILGFLANACGMARRAASVSWLVRSNWLRLRRAMGEENSEADEMVQDFGTLNEMGPKVGVFCGRPGRSTYGGLSADRGGRQRSGMNGGDQARK